LGIIGYMRGVYVQKEDLSVDAKITHARVKNNFTGIRALPVPVVTFRNMSVTFAKVGTPRAIRKGSEDHCLCA